jgi:hypothetical protein
MSPFIRKATTRDNRAAVPPCIDIYGLTRTRTIAAVKRFVIDYAPDAKAMHDIEILLTTKEFHSRPFASAEDLIQASQDEPEEKFATLDDAVAFGIENTDAGFVLYLDGEAVERGIDCRANVTFTYDGQLVFGLGIDDPDEDEKTLARANRLLQELVKQHGCHRGLIAVEHPPPLDATDFDAVQHALAVWPPRRRL